MEDGQGNPFEPLLKFSISLEMETLGKFHYQHLDTAGNSGLK